MNKVTVGLIYGGQSSEHSVSIMSAKSIMKYINHKRYEVIPIYIDIKGRWHLTNGVDPERKLPDIEQILLSMDPDSSGLLIKKAHEINLQKIDVAFPVIHGQYGEDGKIQGLLDYANIPYIGSGVTASALGMDKEYMKIIFEKYSLPIVDYLIFKKSDDIDIKKASIRIQNEIGFPCFVKPCGLGSSIGVSKAKTLEEFYNAVEIAFELDSKIIVEKAVDCQEIECAILGNYPAKVSVLGEIIPKSEFYNYEAKYSENGAELIVNARLGTELTSIIQAMALKAFYAINCSGLARVDFFVEKNSKKVWLNEINTIPGFTDKSVYSKLWEASGVSYSQIIDTIISLAFERRNMITQI